MQALAARWAEAHPAVAASTLLEQAEPAGEVSSAVEVEEERETDSALEQAPAQPLVELEPGWTLIDQPEAERDSP
jgi:hypothetical protein